MGSLGSCTLLVPERLVGGPLQALRARILAPPCPSWVFLMPSLVALSPAAFGDPKDGIVHERSAKLSSGKAIFSQRLLKLSDLLYIRFRLLFRSDFVPDS